MSKYKSGAYPYLAKNLEVPFRDLKRVLDPIQGEGPFAVQPTERERLATSLLQYLRDRGYSDAVFKYLVSDSYDNNGFRPIALLLYFNDYRRSLRQVTGYNVQQVYERARVEQEFQSYMKDRILSAHAKQAIAFAASIVFGHQHERSSDVFIRQAAEGFWDGVDVARGATPVEGTMQSYIYEKVFHYSDPFANYTLVMRDAVPLASESLRTAILKLDLRRLNFDNVRLLFYAYGASPTVGRAPAYLVPADLVEVTRRVLTWADTPEKRKDLSMEFGSLSGDHLFMNMLPNCRGEACGTRRMQPDEVAARCAAARKFGEMLLTWYSKNYTTGWYIPKFFDEMSNEFPDLESRINRKAWGLGRPWKSEESRGCRK